MEETKFHGRLNGHPYFFGHYTGYATTAPGVPTWYEVIEDGSIFETREAPETYIHLMSGIGQTELRVRSESGAIIYAVSQIPLKHPAMTLRRRSQ